MKFASYLLVLLLSLWHAPICISGIVKSFIRNNVAGPAVNLQEQSWPIDPDAGLRRRQDYVAANGLYGYYHVERIGLGEDGRTEERRQLQQIRDSVGGLSYQVPP